MLCLCLCLARFYYITGKQKGPEKLKCSKETHRGFLLNYWSRKLTISALTFTENHRNCVLKRSITSCNLQFYPQKQNHARLNFGTPINIRGFDNPLRCRKISKI